MIKINFEKTPHNFWTNSTGFSIVDLLSLSFSGIYLFIIARGAFGGDMTIINLQQNMNPLMITILGGYFGDQMVKRFTKDNISQENYNTNSNPTQDDLPKI